MIQSAPPVVERGKPRVIDERVRVIETRLQADAVWRDDPSGKPWFSATLQEGNGCETSFVTERAQVQRIERAPRSRALLALNYALGVAGGGLLMVASHQRFVSKKGWEEPDPTPDDPTQRKASPLALEFLAGAGLSLFFVPAILTTVRARDDVQPLAPLVEQTTRRGPCSEPRPLANRRIDVRLADHEYALFTDASGSTLVSRDTLLRAAIPRPEQGAPMAVYVDGVPRAELNELAHVLASGLAIDGAASAR